MMGCRDVLTLDFDVFVLMRVGSGGDLIIGLLEK